MAKILYTIEWDDGEPTIKQVSEKYGFSIGSIDQEFGVVMIDPSNNRFSILVDEDAVLDTSSPNRAEGPFSDPRIEPFDLSSDNNL